MPKSSFITLVEKKIVTFARKQSHSSFNTGLESVDANYDVIMKADADLIFPKLPGNYQKHFQSDVRIGMAGGFCYIEKMAVDS
jgi:hypothetical protein